ncbi:MAG: class I SAM-dependent methyltransferase [Planctomycetaceae bacterium]|jgi:ubiquinone/menaquinone biosynthesis C-methylase UbiE
MPADWQLPPGVSRSLWEFAADRELPSQESSHLGQSPLLTFDAQLVPRWFSTPGPLVDLGCGSGRSLVDFAAAGFACTGVDLSQPSLEFAAQALRDRGLYANLLRANLCELDLLPAEQFDYALLLFGTLGMIATPQARRQALGHAHRLLRPGGRLALHVHSLWPHLFIPGGRQWLLRDLVRRTLGSPAAGDTERAYRGIPHIYHHVFSLRELKRVVQQAGFETLRLVPLRATPGPPFSGPSSPSSKSLGQPSPGQPSPGQSSIPAGHLVLEQTGWARHWRCTGWLLELRKPSG